MTKYMLQENDMVYAMCQDVASVANSLADKLYSIDKQAKVELRVKQQLLNKLQLMMSIMPCGIIEVATDNTIISCNQTAQTMFNCQLVNDCWDDVLLVAKAQKAVKENTWSLANGKIIVITETSLGKSWGKLIVISDLTDIQHVQDKLHQQQKLNALGGATAAIAHQIKTPLASALLYSERVLLVNNCENLQGLQQQLLSINKLLDSMLFLVKGNLPESTKVSWQNCMQDLLAVIAPRCNAANIYLMVVQQHSQLYCWANQNLLVSALLNIVNNALDASMANSLISIWLSVQQENILIKIIDKGKGISAEQQQQIWQPFYTSKNNGTGLGLPIVKMILTAYQGTVSLSSQLGKGTQVEVKLPLYGKEYVD